MTASGETTPRWVVDDDGWLTFDRCIAMILTHPHTLFDGVEMDRSARDKARDALVTDVRAAREHDHCPRDTDTLRQARELARTIIEGRKGGFNTREFADKAEVALLDLLSGETD